MYVWCVTLPARAWIEGLTDLMAVVRGSRCGTMGLVGWVPSGCNKGMLQATVRLGRS